MDDLADKLQDTQPEFQSFIKDINHDFDELFVTKKHTNNPIIKNDPNRNKKNEEESVSLVMSEGNVELPSNIHAELFTPQPSFKERMFQKIKVKNDEYKDTNGSPKSSIIIKEVIYKSISRKAAK